MTCHVYDMYQREGEKGQSGMEWYGITCPGVSAPLLYYLVIVT